MSLFDITAGGDWTPVDTNSTYAQPLYFDSIFSDVVTASAAQETTPVNDSWSGFFQNGATILGGYLMQKDAQKNGMRLATSVNGQPVYQPANNIAGFNSSTLLIVGAVVAVYLMTKH